MHARTTFSLELENLEALKKIAEQRRIKSLSKLVNGILSDFLKNYQKKKKLDQMAKRYKKYAEEFDHKAFSELEEGLLGDLF